MRTARRTGGDGSTRGTPRRALAAAPGAVLAVVLLACQATSSHGDDNNSFVAANSTRTLKPPRQRGRVRLASGRRRGTAATGAIELCPYVINTEEEALARAEDTSLPGNVVTVEHLRFCRTGNHFSSAYRNLALGYCCKSKLVILPPKDDILAPGVFNKGSPGPRWFDFSSAPDVEGFDSSSCAQDITWAGPRAFHMNELDEGGHRHNIPHLRGCIGKVPRLLGCESAYYFPKDLNVCATPDGGEGGRNDAAGVRGLEGEEEEEEVAGEKDGLAGDEEQEQKGAGNLVIHVRSGDIFDNDVLSYYGQPPLQFYTQVLQEQPWDRVDLVTYALDWESLNPVVQVLQAKKEKGLLDDNVHIHTNNTMGQDLRMMICADALTMAKSTLVDLVAFHSKADQLYAGTDCSSKLRGIAKARPKAKVYGVSWSGPYSVYENWENTLEQREEMLTYEGITGLEQCQGH